MKYRATVFYLFPYAFLRCKGEFFFHFSIYPLTFYPPLHHLSSQCFPIFSIFPSYINLGEFGVCVFQA